MSSPESKLKTSPQSWDDSDDELLIRLKEVEHLGWKQIANYFNNRTSNACQFRWRRLKSGQLKKTGRAKRFGLDRTPTNSADEHSYTSESESITSQRIANYINSHPTNTKQFSSANANATTTTTTTNSSWTSQEDTLILSHKVKGLTIMELLILLPNRTGKEIEERIKFLEQKKISVGSMITDTNNNSSDIDRDLSNSRNSSSSSIATVSSFNIGSNNIPVPTLLPNLGVPNLPSTTSITSKYPQQYHYPTHFQPQSQYINQNQSITLPPLQNITNVNNGSLHNNNRNLGSITTPIFKYGDNSQRDQRLPSLSQVYSFISQ